MDILLVICLGPDVAINKSKLIIIIIHTLEMLHGQIQAINKQ